MRFRKKFLISSDDLSFCVCHSVCDDGETKSPCKSFTGKKRPKNGKGQLTELCIEKLFKNVGLVKQPKLPGALPLSPTRGGGLQCPIRTSSCNGQRADAHWIMAYGHKTQSFMKRRRQQKCLDKDLMPTYIEKDRHTQYTNYLSFKVRKKETISCYVLDS